MAAIPLNQMANVYAVSSPPWGKKPLVVRALVYPKGATPPHLKQYRARFVSAARACAAETTKLKGKAARVSAMNACVRARLKGGSKATEEE